MDTGDLLIIVLLAVVSVVAFFWTYSATDKDDSPDPPRKSDGG